MLLKNCCVIVKKTTDSPIKKEKTNFYTNLTLFILLKLQQNEVKFPIYHKHSRRHLAFNGHKLTRQIKAALTGLKALVLV
jgi:hypothetical protein